MDKENYNIEQLKIALAKARKKEKSICVTTFVDSFRPTSDVPFEKTQERKHPLPGSVQGAKTHKFATALLNNTPQEQSNDFDKSFIKWWQDRGGRYTIVGTNLKISSPMYPISGEIDALLYDHRKRKFTVLEIKTKKDMLTAKGRLTPPFSDYKYTNFNLAKLQATLYSFILQEYTSCPIDAMVLWLKKDRYREFPIYTVSEDKSIKQVLNNLKK